jgi:hypothetical protein
MPGASKAGLRRGVGVHVQRLNKNIENNPMQSRARPNSVVASVSAIAIMRELDPRIHHFQKMDCRVKPGNDNQKQRPFVRRLLFDGLPG